MTSMTPMIPSTFHRFDIPLTSTDSTSLVAMEATPHEVSSTSGGGMAIATTDTTIISQQSPTTYHQPLSHEGDAIKSAAVATKTTTLIGCDSTTATIVTHHGHHDYVGHDDVDDDDIISDDCKDHEHEALMTEAEIDALYDNDEHLFHPGDHIRVYKRAMGLWPFYHHGIVTQIRVLKPEGRPPRNVIEKIVHFTHRNRRQRQVICETNLAHFAYGAVDVLQPVHHHNSRYPLVVAARRARQKIGCTRYHPVQRNCEHFATWCHTGRENSAQIRGYAQMAIALSWGAVLGLAINAVASEPSSSSTAAITHAHSTPSISSK